jgi:hypothetical protein
MQKGQAALALFLFPDPALEVDAHSLAGRGVDLCVFQQAERT